jgi:hypothetical protein
MRELVFRAAGGAGSRFDNDVLRWSHACSNHGPAIAAQVIRIAAAAKQRLYRFGRAMTLGTGYRARYLQRNSRHRTSLSSSSGELVFPDNAFMAVKLALYPILKNAGGFGQQANDLEASSAAAAVLVSIGREANGLSNRKLVCRHLWTLLDAAQLGQRSQFGWRCPVIDAFGQSLVFQRDLAQVILNCGGGRVTGELPDPSRVSPIVFGRERRRA